MKKSIVSLGILLFLACIQLLKAEIKILYPHVLPTSPLYDNGIIKVRATTVNNFGPFDLELFKEGQATGKKFFNVNGDVSFTNLEPGHYAIDVKLVGNICKTTLFTELLNCQTINIHDVEMVHDFCYETGNALLRFQFDMGAPNCLIKIISNKQNLLASKTGGPGTHEFTLSNPPIGTHKIVISDPVTLCMVSADFEIKAMPGFLSATFESKRICYSKGSMLVKVMPQNRKYRYLWSDGLSTIENDMTRRDYFYNQPYSLTITDEMTHCSKVYSNVNNPHQLPYAPIHIISYKDATGPDKDDGEITIWLYGNQNSITWDAKIIALRNGISYPPASFSFKNTRKLNVPKLLPGMYEFIIEDALACEVIRLIHEVHSCPIKPEAQIKIYSYSLPPDQPGAYIKANAYYSGDVSKCKYLWYIHNNEYYYKITQSPELNSEGIKSLAWNSNDQICVRMLCPCTTEAYHCIEYDPCNNKTISFVEKTVTNLCSGTLPSGKFVSHRNHGSIHLKINVTSLQKGQFQIGKPEFDYYIHDIFWKDIPSIDYSYNSSSKILTIDRDIFEQRTYVLNIVDGQGCNHSASISVANDFHFEQSQSGGQLHCLFWSACKPLEEASEEETTKHYDNSIRLVGPGECDAELWCGNSKIRNLTSYKSPYYDERELFKDENGQCFTKRICFIHDWADILTDPQNPTYQKLYFNPKEIDPNLQDLRLAVVTNAPAPCCNEENSTSFQIEAGLYHVNAIADGPYNDVHISDPNPCKAILLCPDNSLYVKYYTGTVAEEKYCITNNGQNCWRCVKCSFTINGSTYTAPSYNHKLSFCGPVDPDQCNTNTTCLQGEIPQQNFANGLNESLQLQYFLENFQGAYDSKRSNLNINPLQIQIFDLLGNSLEGPSSFLNPTQLESLLTSIPKGVYLVLIKNDQTITTHKWINW